MPGHWTYTYAKTGDRLHMSEVDYMKVADYYKGDPDGGYRAFVSTDALSSDDLVRLRDFVERDVRARLGIPFNPSAPALQFEHSMGQHSAQLPPNMLRTSQLQSAYAAEHSAGNPGPRRPCPHGRGLDDRNTQ